MSSWFHISPTPSGHKSIFPTALQQLLLRLAAAMLLLVKVKRRVVRAVGKVVIDEVAAREDNRGNKRLEHDERIRRDTSDRGGKRACPFKAFQGKRRLKERDSCGSGRKKASVSKSCEQSMHSMAYVTGTGLGLALLAKTIIQLSHQRKRENTDNTAKKPVLGLFFKSTIIKA